MGIADCESRHDAHGITRGARGSRTIRLCSADARGLHVEKPAHRFGIFSREILDLGSCSIMPKLISLSASSSQAELCRSRERLANLEAACGSVRNGVPSPQRSQSVLAESAAEAAKHSIMHSVPRHVRKVRVDLLFFAAHCFSASSCAAVRFFCGCSHR